MINEVGGMEGERMSDEKKPDGSAPDGAPARKIGDAAAEAVPFCRRPRTRTALLCAGFLVIGFGLGSIVTSAAIHRMVRHGLRDPGRLASKHIRSMSFFALPSSGLAESRSMREPSRPTSAAPASRHPAAATRSATAVPRHLT